MSRSPDFKKLFKAEIDAIARLEGMSVHEVFHMWLDLACRAQFGGALTAIGAQPAWQENEDRYMEQVKRFRQPKKSLDHACAALAHMVSALTEKREDFLGPLFMEFAQNKHMGQFFTPTAVCRLIAEMTVPDVTDLIRENGFVLMNEPACGAAAMVIEACEVMRGRGVDIHRQVHWVMSDISWPAICAAYIQCNLLGISAEIRHENSLSADPAWKVLLTLTAALFPKIKRVAPPEGSTYGAVIDQMIQEAAE